MERVFVGRVFVERERGEGGREGVRGVWGVSCFCLGEGGEVYRSGVRGFGAHSPNENENEKSSTKNRCHNEPFFQMNREFGVREGGGSSDLKVTFTRACSP